MNPDNTYIAPRDFDRYGRMHLGIGESINSSNWVIEKQTTGYYKGYSFIKNSYSGMYLSDNGSNDLELLTSANGDRSSWYISKNIDGYFNFKSKSSGGYIVVYNG